MLRIRHVFACVAIRSCRRALWWQGPGDIWLSVGFSPSAGTLSHVFSALWVLQSEVDSTLLTAALVSLLSVMSPALVDYSVQA